MREFGAATQGKGRTEMTNEPGIATKPLAIEWTDDLAAIEWNELAGGSLSALSTANPALGHHLLVELYGCEAESLCGVERIEHVMLDAARASKASVVTHHFHSFKPYGVSGAVIIQESHYTIHTWPEYGYAAVDLFFCSYDVDVDKAIAVFQEALHPQRVKLMLVRRGRV